MDLCDPNAGELLTMEERENGGKEERDGDVRRRRRRVRESEEVENIGFTFYIYYAFFCNCF